MREILFKAKRIDNGEWVEGSLIDLYADSVYCCIVPTFKSPSTLPFSWLVADRMALVVPETLCQFTGLCDKNGNKIWENDIVNHNGEYAPVKFGRYCSSFDYGKCNLGFYVDFPEETFFRKDIGWWYRKVEVAGNIFDNKELLQEVPE